MSGSLFSGPNEIFLLSLASLVVFLRAFKEGAGGLTGLLASLALIAFNFYLLYQAIKKKNFIEAIPTLKVRSLAMGMAEVRGIAEKFDRVLISPYFKKPCFAWEVKIKRGKETDYDRQDGYFYLRDETGRVLVHTKGAELDVPAEEKFILFKGHITEKRIEPGKMYYIIGLVKDNPFVRETTAQRGYEDLMIGEGGELFVISDKGERKILKMFNAAIITCVASILVGTFYIVHLLSA